MRAERPALWTELGKIAASRAAREARKALEAGRVGEAKDIAEAYRKLELSPRYLKDVSPGGVEGAVDLMMGHMQGMDPDASGLIARKMYKPDSWLAQGEHMGRALEQKKRFIDEMRGLSPEAREMTPAMYGFRQITGKGDAPLHVSYHEYVPELRKMKSGDKRIKGVVKNVLGPMEARGKQVHDVAGYAMGGFGRELWHHPENLMVTPGGTPKILDIWPRELGKPNPIEEWRAKNFIFHRPSEHNWNFAPSILGIRPNTPAEPEEAAMYIQGLRKHIFGKPGEAAFPEKKEIARRLLKQKKKRLGAKGLHAPENARRARELARAAGVNLPDKPLGMGKKMLKLVKKHPLATGLIAAGGLGLGLGGAAYLKRRKQKKMEQASREAA